MSGCTVFTIIPTPRILQLKGNMQCPCASLLGEASRFHAR
nr:MAG TPA: hypothetical protein [Bacteriophage sp.]